MKIIYLVDEVFSDRDYNRFGVDLLLKEKFSVECWVFSKLHEDALFAKGELNECSTNKINLVMLESDEDVISQAQKIRNALVFDNRGRLYGEYSKQWFIDGRALLVDTFQGEIPLYRYKQTIKDKYTLSEKSITNVFFKVIRKIKECLYRGKQQSYIPSGIIISGGTSKCNENAKLCIESHSLDYDLYLSAGKKIVEESYVVFLDEMAVNAPDYKIHGMQPHCTHNKYYDAMNVFFDRIEKEVGVPVVISTHPRGNIMETKNNYGGRKTFQGKTPELVRDSRTVIAHASTSISFAVLWQVPLLIITTDELELANYLMLESLSKELEIKRINIDHLVGEYDWNALSKEPIKKYSEYKRKYIKAEGTPEKNSWEIFFDEIKKYDRVNSV